GHGERASEDEKAREVETGHENITSLCRGDRGSPLRRCPFLSEMPASAKSGGPCRSAAFAASAGAGGHPARIGTSRPGVTEKRAAPAGRSAKRVGSAPVIQTWLPRSASVA